MDRIAAVPSIHVPDHHHDLTPRKLKTTLERTERQAIVRKLIDESSE